MASPPTQNSWYRSRLDTLKHLPHPDERWVAKDAHERVTAVHHELSTQNLINRVGTRENEEDRRGGIGLWQTDPAVYERVQELLDERPEHDAPAMPCGDHGFVNVGDGLLDCKFDECDGGPWTKTAIKHYWDHGELPTSAPTDERAVATDGGTDASVSLGPLKTPDGERVQSSTPEQSWLPLPCGHRDYSLLDADKAHWVTCEQCDSHFYQWEVKPDA